MGADERIFEEAAPFVDGRKRIVPDHMKNESSN
jgi:hypothetical protein